jgi:hypothetical protein
LVIYIGRPAPGAQADVALSSVRVLRPAGAPLTSLRSMLRRPAAAVVNTQSIQRYSVSGPLGRVTDSTAGFTSTRILVFLGLL